jgi:hypothetical protein
MEDLIVQSIKSSFGNRVVCLLYYGSNAFPEKKKSLLSDYDFCLVLDKSKSKDLEKLKEITSSYRGIDLTLHYLNDLEDRGWTNFQHGSHGAFFLLHLASARTLIGENIFARKTAFLDKRIVRDSIEHQITEYFWRLTHWYLLEMDENKLCDLYEKYLIRIAQDMLAARGDISFDEINTMSHKDIVTKFIAKKRYFSKKTIKFFMDTITKQRKKSLSFSYFNNLRDSLYNDFKRDFKR